MEGKIERARGRYEERQKAVLGKQFEESEHGMVTESQDSVKMMLSGLDIDNVEMVHASIDAVEAALGAIQEGAPPMYVLKGLWVNGLLTGLFIEED